MNGYVELGQPASVRDIKILQNFATDDATKQKFAEYSEKYQDLVLAKRVTVLDILEDFTDINLPFAVFLQMVPPMRVRQYSISSSPLANPGYLSLTVSILEAPAISGRKSMDGNTAKFFGVASTFLARLRSGDRIPVVVRQSSAAFHLPTDPSIPVVMFCAGSGMAPFRSFIEERAAQKASGRDVGKMMLFYGCRAPDVDFLYSTAELKKWTEEGVVDVRPAFSRSDDPGCCGCKYVQEYVQDFFISVAIYLNCEFVDVQRRIPQISPAFTRQGQRYTHISSLPTLRLTSLLVLHLRITEGGDWDQGGLHWHHEEHASRGQRGENKGSIG